MKETDRQYYTRRGNEERRRSRTATSSETQNLHAELSDLCHAQANGSVNENGKSGIRGRARTRD